MAGGFPLGWEWAASDNSGAAVVSVPSNASNNVKGSYTTLIASTAVDAVALGLYIRSISGSYAVDIAVGSAGNEVIIIQNLLIYPGTDVIGAEYCFPVQIPAGSRISARCQCSVGGNSASIIAVIFDGAFGAMEGAAGADSIGVITAGVTQSTTTTSGSSGVKGSYVQLVASTSRDYMGFVIVTEGAVVNNNVVYDVAIGGAGSEQIIYPNYGVRGNTAGAGTPQSSGYIPIPIPAGTRVAARSQDGTGAQLNNIGIYGVYQ